MPVHRAVLACRRFHYLDPLTYSVEGLIASQLGDVHNEYINFEDGTTTTVARFVQVPSHPISTVLIT